MKRTRYRLDGMDCPSEEQMVRMALDPIDGVGRLDFDLSSRTLDVFHEGPVEPIFEALDGLRLGTPMELAREDEVAPDEPDASSASERGPLLGALAINGTLFVGELVAGIVFASMGLVADSLDMLADALVYSLSLAAVGRDASRKRSLAAASGYLQLGLAFAGLGEVVRRFFIPEAVPDVSAMIAVSVVALAGNVLTLWLLRGAKRGEAHVEASWIFTSNDVLVNVLVVVAGLLVWWSASRLPDLLVGGLMFLIVANGARRILGLARRSSDADD
ncbi:MAG: cation transporter [Sandaracinus sp.]|nr:cation transporter [Sandaracinus sp.]